MKKITKFLDSVMGGIKRTCIAKALAVFAVASIAINANAQGSVNPEADFEGLDGLTGKTIAELMKAAVGSSEAFPTDKSKIFFLYNVRSGKFLTAGGYWGTHAAIADYGKPMCVEYGTRWYFRLDMQTGTGDGQGKYLDWAVPNNNNEKDKGVYVDRDKSSGYGWKLEEVKGKQLLTNSIPILEVKRGRANITSALTRIRFMRTEAVRHIPNLRLLRMDLMVTTSGASLHTNKFISCRKTTPTR